MEIIELKPKILYVDDEEENLMVFKSSFRRNYQVSIAHSVTEANALLTDQSFDIIISDQRMPDTTGVEFLKSLPDEPENIRMILTGYSDMEAIIDAMNSGKIYKYITKPWDQSELQGILDIALKTKIKKLDDQQKISQVMNEMALLEEVMQNPANKDNGHILSHAKLETEIKELTKRVKESDSHVQLLSEIGQEIISNITVVSIIESAYSNVNALMDASVFGIGIYNEETGKIEFPGSIEKGKQNPPWSLSLEADRPATRAFNNKTEYISNNYSEDSMKHFNLGINNAVVGEPTNSLMYLPLFSNNKAIGVVSVQSFKMNAYSNYHLNILRNIAIYIATAIENANIYKVIEEQKQEIEQKNIELENKVKQRTEQLQSKNDEVLKQKDEIEATYSKIKLLSEIGQQITSTLALEKIIETVYQNVNSLMDAAGFGIGVFNPVENRIEFFGFMEKGEKLPFWFASMEEDNRLAVWSFKNVKEAIINDFQTEYNKYIKSIPRPKAGEEPDSILYLPLVANDGPIGVITVQSFKKHIYNQYHIDILRSLASYITIAIQNSTSYRKMTQAFEDLKAAQMKLVEAEKMASLGVLTAGVAHEINNPVNFITAGINSLKNNYRDVEELLKLYLDFDPEKSPKEHWQAILNLKRKIDPDELLPEMEILFNSITSGANRTSEIVKGLRNFTRLDENDMKKAKIEEGIDSTLVILNNKLKNRIQIVKEYENIPPILCYPGQLNQVFMNLLHNASDAIESEGTIHIQTKQADNKVIITIKDNGKGIPPNVLSHIFEPFYTTKEVGKGTGLGLSIAYGIIEKHKGKIEVNSESGKGTEFIITLPIQ